MGSWIVNATRELARRRTQWRRARNLRAGGALRPAARPWGALAACAAALAGALVLAGHARHLSAVAAPAAGTHNAALDALQPAVPGLSFDVPAAQGVSVARSEQGALVIAAGMQAGAPVHINLCRQMQGGHLLPLRIGYRFDTLSQLAAQGVPLRNAVLASADASTPPFEITAARRTDLSLLNVSWPQGQARWVSDAGAASFRGEGWLIGQDGAVRVQRRSSRHCASGGELVLRSYRKADEPSALAQVIAIPKKGSTVAAMLPAGRHSVPSSARASLEDQALFQQLLGAGLLRLSEGGLAQVAPRDLGAWQKSAPDARAGQLRGWPLLDGDERTAALFKRLYRMADGAYVREQVRIFNNERRLLAWRVRPALAGASWQVTVDGAPVPAAEQLPLAAARLFADVPQGWVPWQRAAAWPGDGAAAGGTVRLTMQLPQPAPARVQMLLAGRVLQMEGARLAQAPRPACTGRACRSPSAVSQIELEVSPLARSVSLVVAPLESSMLAEGPDQYRHLHVSGGRLAWRTLSANSAMARAGEAANVVLQDRHGAPLWRGGEPEAAALRAGLGTLLGLRAGHDASVAGMLARLPAPDGRPHVARLTLDLALQQAAHSALDCVGLRRGRWNGAACSGAGAVPAGRQAGLVIIDTGSGDILAAAGVGGSPVTADNWSEVRDFDRANPDRSPLRLPALQHDGGAHRSPGSTFKIISALGLELAAANDPQLAGLLGGMPLAAINRQSAARGFDFQTASASYPVTPGQARITNYRDGHLDRRARGGRIGLPEALTYSLNTWFAWSGELSDRSLFGRSGGGAADLQALEAGALDSVRPIVAMAHRIGFEREIRLDGGLLPPHFRWQQWDALQPSEARIDPIHTRHELRQMAIGLRMQATPLHMAMAAGAVGEGRVIAPRLLLELDGDEASDSAPPPLGVRLDRIRAGMKGVVDAGTAASAFDVPALAALRRGLSGKTGTSPAMVSTASGQQRELATVWFTGWLEPDSIRGEKRRLAIAAFISHSEGSGGDHAAPVVASVLASMAAARGEPKGEQNAEQKGN